MQTSRVTSRLFFSSLLLIFLFLTFTIFNCGDLPLIDDPSTENNKSDLGHLSLHLNLSDALNIKSLTYQNITSVERPAFNELILSVKVTWVAKLYPDNSKSFTFDKKEEGSPIELAGLELGSVHIEVDASISDKVYYKGSVDAEVIAGFKVKSEILLNEVFNKVDTGSLDLDMKINHRPIIESFDINSLKINVNEIFEMKAVCKDPDGDSLNYKWSIMKINSNISESIQGDYGNITETSAEPKYTWTPFQPGKYTIKFEVLDVRSASTDFDIDVEVVDASILLHK